jgi:hypothetical protein
MPRKEAGESGTAINRPESYSAFSTTGTGVKGRSASNSFGWMTYLAAAVGTPESNNGRTVMLRVAGLVFCMVLQP